MFDIQNKKRIVFKIGTSTLTHKSGRLNIRRTERFVKALADLHNSGLDIILVSSGAIAMGLQKMGLTEKPKDTVMKQACAAVGQCELMYFYDKLFGEYNINVAQILITKYVMESVRRNNIENTFFKLLDSNIIPIVNENDTVAIDELELEVGENDSLAANVAVITKADMLVILSDIDGFYDGDPNSPESKVIPVIENVDDHIRALAGDAGSALGTGGMHTKLNAAEIANSNGIDMAIINGRLPENIYRLFDGEGIGTIFTAK